MKERTQDAARDKARGVLGVPALRPIDGFVVGGATGWDTRANLWVLLSRPGERLIDFFLEDDDQRDSTDPLPCACTGLLPDGRVTIGAVDWDLDRFLSEIMDEGESTEASITKGVSR